MVGAKLLHSSLALLTLRSRARSPSLVLFAHSALFSSLFLTHSATAVRDVWLKKVALKVQLPGPGLDIDYAPLLFSPLRSSPPTCALSRSLTLHLHYLCISRWGLRQLRRRLRCWMFSVFASFPFCMCCVISVAKSVKRERGRDRERD